MILLIDNYDSFVHNLARYFMMEGTETKVVRNDAISVDTVKTMAPDGIVLSPGPCTPAEAGICTDLVRTLGRSTPILGVCLGHQAIGAAYGLQTIRAPQPMHGKACTIKNAGNGIFNGLPSSFTAGRYHSLIIEEPDETSPLFVTAHDEHGTIMAVQHKTNPVYGIQFHPESILTEHGPEIIRNFLSFTRTQTKERAA